MAARWTPYNSFACMVKEVKLYDDNLAIIASWNSATLHQNRKLVNNLKARREKFLANYYTYEEVAIITKHCGYVLLNPELLELLTP